MRDREIRAAADSAVEVLIGAAVRPSRLVNLSSGGAFLADMRGLLADMHVTICHGQWRGTARIMWCRSGVAGVRLVTPLSRGELRALHGDAVEWRLAS